MYRINLGNGQTQGNHQSPTAARRELRKLAPGAFIERYHGFGQWRRVA